MKKILTLSGVPLLLFACTLSLSSFAPGKTIKAKPVSHYSISMHSKVEVGTGEEWTWVLTNPNPGTGNHGTLQDVSHLSIAIPFAAEAALLSADYSRDGVTWHAVSTSVDRDPAIRACTNIDVLKFDMGSIGSQPIYYRAKFNRKFDTNPYATCWIKTGGGIQGCNVYYFAGIGAIRQD